MALRLVLLALMSAAPSAVAQISIPGADGQAIGVLSGQNSVNVDIAQAKLGVTALWTFNRGSAASAVEAVNRDHIDLSLRFAASAKDGARSILSGGRVTPGLEAGGSLSYVWERPQGGYTAIYVPLLSRLVEANAVTFDNAQARLVDGATKSLGTGLGLIVAPTESVVFGASMNLQRNWDSPGQARPKQVCTLSSAGVDAAGATVSASQCAERFVGPFIDETVWSPRVESVIHFAGDSAKPSVGLLASLSGAKRTGADMSFSAAVGPTLHPKGRPRETLVAMLLSLSDFSDANQTGRTLRDMFAIKLFLAVPLTGF